RRGESAGQYVGSFCRGSSRSGTDERPQPARSRECSACARGDRGLTSCGRRRQGAFRRSPLGPRASRRGSHRSRPAIVLDKRHVSRATQLTRGSFGPSSQDIDSTIHSGLDNAGQADQSCNGSLPYRSVPVWLAFLASLIGFAHAKPSFRRSCSMSPGLPVRIIHPGPTPYALSYLLSSAGVSCSGVRVNEYMKMSRPTRSFKSFCTRTRLAVAMGQRPSSHCV